MLKYVDDKAMVRSMFAEMQPFKGVDNYFTQQVVKEPLSGDIFNGSEAYSELEEDMSATFAMEPIVPNLNDLDCHNLVDNDYEWVINECCF